MSQESKPDLIIMVSSSDDVISQKKRMVEVLAIFKRVVKVLAILVMAVILFLDFADGFLNQLLALENRQECKAVLEVGKNLFFNEIMSMNFFTASSFVALILVDMLHSRFNRVLFSASLVGGVAGLVFLALSIVSVIRKQIGLVSCGSQHAVSAVQALFGCSACMILIGFLIGCLIRDTKSSSCEEEEGKSLPA